MAEQDELSIGNNVEIQTMPKEAAAKAWAAQHRINDDAVEKLFEEGFNSLDAIKLIEPDDLAKSKISKGQRKLIIECVRKLNRTLAVQTGETAQYSLAASASNLQGHSGDLARQAGITVNQMPSSQTGIGQPANQTATESSQPTNQTAAGSSPPDGQTHASHGLSTEDPYLRALLQQLQAGQAQNTQSVNSGTLSFCGINNSAQFQTGQSFSNSDINVPPVESWKDPQIHLSRTALGKSSPSHYDITDFVTGMIEEEVVVGGNGSQQIVLKSGPKKPKLENVTLAQWCVANNAILYRLVSESKLHLHNMLDYISYGTKICELVQRFTLLSVLLYDRNYRQLQAQNGFRWGTDVPHLQNVHLIPRMPRSNSNQLHKGGPSQPNRAPQNPGPLTLDGRVICKLFNTKAGCHFKECRYVHQCSHNGCYQAHSATTHYQGKN